MYWFCVIIAIVLCYSLFELCLWIVEGIDGMLIYRLFFKHKKIYRLCRVRRVDSYIPNEHNPHRINEFPTISFKQFEDFYNVNPESWELYKCFVRKNKNNDMMLTFTYPEYRKYQKFYERVQENQQIARELALLKQKTDRQNEIMYNVLEAVQQDIDAVREEYKKSYDDYIKLTKELM